MQATQGPSRVIPTPFLQPLPRFLSTFGENCPCSPEIFNAELKPDKDIGTARTQNLRTRTGFGTCVF